ncbi:MAG TPA: hypothetical protein VNH18_19975, partial [Bryobacteraceae bacterium]|nr:hypothetical protein [Bryobacteraceae bacterium]
LKVRDVTWINSNGSQMTDENWHDAGIRCFGMLLDGRAPTSGIKQRGKEATILIIVNGHYDGVEFTLPPCAGASWWDLLIDTNIPEPASLQTFAIGASYVVTGRSLLVFGLEAAE